MSIYKRITYKATIIELIDDRNIRVMLEVEEEMVASVSGKVRMVLYEKLDVGNEVIVEISPYDETRCRITYR